MVEIRFQQHISYTWIWNMGFGHHFSEKIMWFYIQIVSIGRDFFIMFGVSFSFALLSSPRSLRIYFPSYLSVCLLPYLPVRCFHALLDCPLNMVIHTPLTNSHLSFFPNDHWVFFSSLSPLWNNCLLLTRSALDAKCVIQELIFKQNPQFLFESGLTDCICHMPLK